MEVQIEILGTAKPLVDHQAPLRPSAGNRTTEVVIPRQSIPQTERQGQHPLPNRGIGEDPIDQTGGTLGHATSTAARAEAAPLAREDQEPVVAATGATDPGEPARQPAAAQEGPELRFDDPGQPNTVAEDGHVRPERLKLIAHRAIDDIVLGTTRQILE